VLAGGGSFNRELRAAFVDACDGQLDWSFRPIEEHLLPSVAQGGFFALCAPELCNIKFASASFGTISTVEFNPTNPSHSNRLSEVIASGSYASGRELPTRAVWGVLQVGGVCYPIELKG
jgi:hypothetical protein